MPSPGPQRIALQSKILQALPPSTHQQVSGSLCPHPASEDQAQDASMCLLSKSEDGGHRGMGSNPQRQTLLFRHGANPQLVFRKVRKSP